MKIKAIVNKVIKFNPNSSDDTSGAFRVWLDFGEVYSAEALALFALQGTENVLEVELNDEK